MTEGITAPAVTNVHEQGAGVGARRIGDRGRRVRQDRRRPFVGGGAARGDAEREGERRVGRGDGGGGRDGRGDALLGGLDLRQHLRPVAGEALDGVGDRGDGGGGRDGRGD